MRYRPLVQAWQPSTLAYRGDGFAPFGNKPPELLPAELCEFLPYLDDEVPLQQGSGSGFVVNLQNDRFLVMNYHVVQDALQVGTTQTIEGASIYAVFSGDEKDPIALRFIGANPSFDLALG